jgi:hypothetical protein
MTACVAPLTTVVLDAAPNDLGGSGLGREQCGRAAWRPRGIAALGFAFGGRSASDVASIAVAQAYRRVIWTAVALAAAVIAMAWLGKELQKRREN